MGEQEGEASGKLKEHKTAKALSYPIKVIVSPLKAFREITTNPNLSGIFLIIALLVLFTTGTEYLRASKIILDSGTQSTSLVASNLFSGYIASYLIQTISSFVLNWIICAGVLLVLVRFLGDGGESTIRGRRFYIIVGYAFIIVVVYILFSLLLVSSFPEIHFEMSAWVSTAPEDAATVNGRFAEVWGQTLAARVLNYLSLVFQFWLIGLIAIAVHFSKEIKWTRAILLSAAAYFTSIFLATFLTLFVS